MDKATDLLRDLCRAYQGMDPAPVYVHRARALLEERRVLERGAPALVELVQTFARRWGRVKVDVGCGLWPRGEDFLTVDRHAGDLVKVPADVPQADGTVVQGLVETPLKADVRADMWDLPFEDATVDEIWCSHALEHVPMVKVIETLKEFARVLRPGGRCIVTVPNFDYVAKYWLLGADRSWAERLVVGLQDTPGEFHQCCFNAELLRGDLEGSGFEVKVLKLVQSHNQECLQAVAVRKAAAA